MSKVKFNQAGYVGTKMSVRAVEAYDNGMMPLSKWTKKAIIEQINYMLANERQVIFQEFSFSEVSCRIKNFDKHLARQAIEVINSKLTKWSKEDLRNEFLMNAGYHHTGAYARKTFFYEVDYLKVYEIIELLGLSEELKDLYEPRELEVNEYGRKTYKDFKYYLDNIVYNKHYWKD